MFRKKEILILVLASLFIINLGAYAAPRDFPARDLTIIVTYAPGGGTDMVTRGLAMAAEKELGVRVLIRNMPSSSGVVGLQAGVNAKPDGYTLVGHSNESFMAPMLGQANYTFDDATPLMLVSVTYAGWHVRSDAPWNSLKEWVDWARKHPGKGKVASLAPGHIWWYAPAALKDLENLEFTIVPYKGGGPSIPAVLGGHVDVTSCSLNEVLPHVKAGKIKVLGIAAAERNQYYPQHPTFKEQGYDVVVGAVIGLSMPNGVPKARQKFLHDAFKRAVNSQQFKDYMAKGGFEIIYKDPEGFKAFSLNLGNTYKRLAEKAGIIKK